MIRIDLRDEGRADAAQLGVIPELSRADRDAAIATWKGRMVNETISSRVFAGLVPQMLRAGIQPRWIAPIADAVVEELRHGRECAAVVHALGGDPYAEIPTLAELPEHEDAPAVEAVMRNVMSISCLSETVAVALIGAERLRAGPETIRDALGRILADEVRHARTGWELIANLAPEIDDEIRARLNRYLVVAFRHLVAHELAHLPVGAAPSEQAAEVGVCDGDEARIIFFDTVHNVIIPRLEALGFAAQDAWSQAGDVAAA